MGTNVEVKQGGIGLLGLLTVILFAGKVFGFIDCSWLWVFAPIWLPAVVLLMAFGILTLIVAILDR